MKRMVGERGFEPPTPWSRTRCSTRLSHSPNMGGRSIHERVRPGALCPSLCSFECNRIPSEGPSLHSRLKAYLYAFHLPVGGCDCHVVFNHVRDNLNPAHKQYLPMSHNWQHRPPLIALGHELIHSWRAVSGKVLYPYGWEEEAMTVGLPPFTYMEFTENKIRVEYGELAVRPDYQNIQTKTSLTDGQKLGVDRSNMAWQGNQGALHAQQGLAQAMSSRSRAMG